MSDRRRTVAQTTSSRRSDVVHDTCPEPGPGEVLLAVTASGVCASDLPLWNDPGQGPARYGHEVTGVIAALGDQVSSWRVGDVATALAHPTHASHVVTGAPDLVRLPGGLDPGTAIGEPLACVVQAVDRARIIPGERVGVVGLGHMGLLAAQVALARGAGELVPVDRLGWRTSWLRDRVGSRLCAAAVEQPESCDVVLEFTGTSSGLHRAGELTRANGRLVIGGYHHQNKRTLELDWWSRGLDLLAGFTPDRVRMRAALADGMALAAAGLVDLSGSVSHVLPLDGLDQAYRWMTGRADGYIKAVLQP